MGHVPPQHMTPPASAPQLAAEMEWLPCGLLPGPAFPLGCELLEAGQAAGKTPGSVQCLTLGRAVRQAVVASAPGQEPGRKGRVASEKDGSRRIREGLVGGWVDAEA